MIDRSRLLEMMDGDEGIVDKFIDKFKALVVDQIELIDIHLQNENIEILSNTVHVLKTQCAYLGLDDISQLAQTIENALGEGAAVSSVAGKLNLLRTQLQQELNSIAD